MLQEGFQEEVISQKNFKEELAQCRKRQAPGTSPVPLRESRAEVG